MPHFSKMRGNNEDAESLLLIKHRNIFLLFFGVKSNINLLEGKF